MSNTRTEIIYIPVEVESVKNFDIEQYSTGIDNLHLDEEPYLSVRNEITKLKEGFTKVNAVKSTDIQGIYDIMRIDFNNRGKYSENLHFISSTTPTYENSTIFLIRPENENTDKYVFINTIDNTNDILKVQEVEYNKDENKFNIIVRYSFIQFDQMIRLPFIGFNGYNNSVSEHTKKIENNELLNIGDVVIISDKIKNDQQNYWYFGTVVKINIDIDIDKPITYDIKLNVRGADGTQIIKEGVSPESIKYYTLA